MARIAQIDPDLATGKAKQLLDGVKSKLGIVPNMTRAMANAPAVLNGYLQLSGALAQGELPATVREQIALLVGEINGCEYCLSAHSAIGKMAGLSAEQITDSRKGHAVDSKVNTLLRFAKKLVDDRGRVTDADLQTLHDAGWDDGIIAEVVANVALNNFTNYFNHVAETEVDFPKVEPIDHHEVCSTIPGCDVTR